MRGATTPEEELALARAYVRARIARDPESGCWVWKGTVCFGGYGQFWIRPGKRVRSHRFTYEDVKGPIPPGLVLDHLCRNRLCCNPDHLEAVTQRENILRGVGWTAQQAVKTHCHRGHEFTPENTIPQAGGKHRRCRTCMQMLARIAYARKRDEAKARALLSTRLVGVEDEVITSPADPGSAKLRREGEG